MSALLDAPAAFAVGTAVGCAACGGKIRSLAHTSDRGILCTECGAKAPRALVVAYHAARNRVFVEGQPERQLEVAIANLVAGVRGEALPYAEPPPAASFAPPHTPPPPPRTILPPAAERVPAMTATKKVRSTCRKCRLDFEYPSKGGRPRTTCDECNKPKPKTAAPQNGKHTTKRVERRVAVRAVEPAPSSDPPPIARSRGDARAAARRARVDRGASRSRAATARGLRRIRGR